MNTKLVRGYVLAILSLLILAAAGLLLVMNLGNSWQLHVYFKTVQLPRAAWLILAAAGGLITWWTLTKVLPAGISALRAGIKLRREKEAREQLKALSDRSAGPGQPDRPREQ